MDRLDEFPGITWASIWIIAIGMSPNPSPSTSDHCVHHPKEKGPHGSNFHRHQCQAGSRVMLHRYCYQLYSDIYHADIHCRNDSHIRHRPNPPIKLVRMEMRRPCLPNHLRQNRGTPRFSLRRTGHKIGWARIVTIVVSITIRIFSNHS